MRLSELSSKDVISDVDGCRLGQVVDLDINVVDGKVNNLIVAKGNKLLSIFTKERLEIPWSKIVKVGNDVILVVDVTKEKTLKEQKS